MISQRNNTGLLFRVAKRLKGNETGVALVETLVALAILGLIAVAFLSGLTTVAQATLIADERATAESLARSQMEYVKNQGYVSNPDPGSYEKITTPADSNYSIEILPVPIDPDTGELSEEDMGIQKITVTVEHNGNQVITLVGYKLEP